jgi:hypothetical protein
MRKLIALLLGVILLAPAAFAEDMVFMVKEDGSVSMLSNIQTASEVQKATQETKYSYDPVDPRSGLGFAGRGHKVSRFYPDHGVIVPGIGYYGRGGRYSRFYPRQALRR